MLKRLRARRVARRRGQDANARAVELAVAAFSRTHSVAPMGAQVLRIDNDEAVVRVMFLTTHLPPDRAWYSISAGGVRALSYDDVAHLERPWR